MGSPAKAVRPVRDKERMFMTYSAGHYVDIAKVYLARGDGRVEAT